MKKCKPDQLSNDTIQPLIDWCEMNKSVGGNRKAGAEFKSGIAEVMRRFTEITGETPPRCQFQRWLKPDKKQRTQPGFGTGLILMMIFEAITRQQKEHVARAALATLEAAIRNDDWKSAQASADLISQMSRWLQLSDEQIGQS
jgi:hypothetical protein